MAEITAGMVKELRELTGARMMECKKALDRGRRRSEKGRGAAAHQERRQGEQGRGRVAAEGVVARSCRADGKLGALVELNCETDFVAKNEDFVAFAKALRGLVATRNPRTSRRCRSCRSMAARSKRAAQGACSEDRREHDASAASGACRRRASSPHYLHGDAKIGVLVDYRGGDEARQGPRDAHRVRQAGACRTDRGAGRRSSSESATSQRRSARRIRQARRDRRQDGRGRGQQVPRRK